MRSHDGELLIQAADAARKIADRLAAKGKDKTLTDPKHWTAMSAGARMVAVRLVEMADDADGAAHRA